MDVGRAGCRNPGGDEALKRLRILRQRSPHAGVAEAQHAITAALQPTVMQHQDRGRRPQSVHQDHRSRLDVLFSHKALEC